MGEIERDVSRAERKAERKAERRAKRDELVAEIEVKRELKAQGLLPLGSSQKISERGRNGKIGFEVSGLRREVRKAVGKNDRQLIPYRSIQAVSHDRRSLGRDRVELALSNDEIEWKVTPDAERFVNTLNAILTGTHPELNTHAIEPSAPLEASPPTDPRSRPSAEPDTDAGVADDLVKLADLHRQGMLSDDEFAAAKAKLLA